MRLCEVTCAPRTRGLGTGALTRGNTDGSVTATLKQGHRVCAADTAILRGGIALVQSLQHHPGPGKGKSGHIRSRVRFTAPGGLVATVRHLGYRAGED